MADAEDAAPMEAEPEVESEAPAAPEAEPEAAPAKSEPYGVLPAAPVVEFDSSKPLEKTYAMIKPDAVRAGNVDNILQMVKDAGFVIVAKSVIHLTKEQAADFYNEHKARGFFGELVDFMSSGPSVALVLARVGAIYAWRELLGPTNTQAAVDKAPNSIRALFGTDGTMNACHGSDSSMSALREIKFFFPHLILDPRPTADDAAAYITAKLQGPLVAGLTELCKAKPSASKLESITWLANWLIRNNPAKPVVG